MAHLPDQDLKPLVFGLDPETLQSTVHVTVH